MFERHSQPTPKEPLLALIRPMADLRLFLADMAAYPRPGSDMDSWLRANERFRVRVLDQLRDSGPLASREIPDTSEVPWVSSGWRNARNVNEMLEALGLKGEVAVSARRGRERIWDLAERVYPPNTPVVPREEAHAIRNERWLKALGVARPKIVGEAGIAAEIEGTKGAWRLDPDATAEGFKGRTALLSPFDRLTHDRVRAMDLFGFEFLLEIYKPRDKRRWGFYALPILHGDAMVGKVDATADRAAGVLRVDAVHEDVPFTPAIRGAVDAELDALARWLGLEVRRTR